MAGFICSICQPLIMFFDVSKVSFLRYLPALLYKLLATVARIPKSFFCSPSLSFFFVVRGGGFLFSFLHCLCVLAVLLFATAGTRIAMCKTALALLIAFFSFLFPIDCFHHFLKTLQSCLNIFNDLICQNIRVR